MRSLAPPSSTPPPEPSAEQLATARFYTREGALILDFTVLDHDELVYVAFNGAEFVPQDVQGVFRPGRLTRRPKEPSVPPPDKAYMASLRQVRDGLADESEIKVIANARDTTLVLSANPTAQQPRSGQLDKHSPAVPSEGAIANRVMSRSASSAGIDLVTPRGTAQGLAFVRNGPPEQGKKGQPMRVYIAVGVSLAVLLATIGVWVLLRAATTAVCDRLRAPTCVELGNPAGCKPLPDGCHTPPPWMQPFLEEAAEEALGRMPFAPFPPSEQVERIPLRSRSFLARLFTEDTGPQVRLSHAYMSSTTKLPLPYIGACWHDGASRAQLVPDSFVFRFYDWHALMGANYQVEMAHEPPQRRLEHAPPSLVHTSEDVEPSRGPPRRQASDHMDVSVLASGQLSVLVAGAVLLEHVPLWDLGRKGVNVTGCESHFWAVHQNASLDAAWAESWDAGREDGPVALAREVGVSQSANQIAASLGPLLCGWFNRSNTSTDVEMNAHLAAFAARNPREVTTDNLGRGRIGGGRVIDKDGSASRTRRLQLSSVPSSETNVAGLNGRSLAEAPPSRLLKPERMHLSTLASEGPPWQGLQRELDVALDEVMPLLLMKVRTRRLVEEWALLRPLPLTPLRLPSREASLIPP